MRMFAQKVNYCQGELHLSSLKNLLVNTEGRAATNPKDVIYGVLGLVEDRSRKSIVVDYTPSMTPMLVSACKVIVEDDARDLSWVWHAFGHNAGGQIKDLPSWCPDLTA